MTGQRIALWIVGTLALLLSFGWLALILLLGHDSYVVSGNARISRVAAERARFPAIVCVGKGGPLETSGVYASPVGLERDVPSVVVLCGAPASDLSMPYSTSVYSGTKPRHMHAYVWLEHHPELETSCSDGAERLDVSPDLVSGYRSESPVESPCYKPLPGAVLGYAVAFVDFFSGTDQRADVELRPNGYPGSRTLAH